MKFVDIKIEKTTVEQGPDIEAEFRAVIQKYCEDNKGPCTPEFRAGLHAALVKFLKETGYFTPEDLKGYQFDVFINDDTPRIITVKGELS
jgi:hypothetical protein